jgi:hypothetical protein
MKKGCFIKGIFILTIVIGVIVYLVQTKFDTLILNPGKKYLTAFVSKGVNKNMMMIKESPEKDSLKALLSDFFDHKLLSIHSFSDKMFEPLTDSLKSYSQDGIIDKKELNNIKQILQKIEDEGSKKN